jgi:uncharacterized protein Yka (UPF0111/DUF47 family)
MERVILEVREVLLTMSSHIMRIEQANVDMPELKRRLSQLPPSVDRDRVENKLNKVEEEFDKLQKEILSDLQSLASRFRQKQ